MAKKNPVTSSAESKFIVTSVEVPDTAKIDDHSISFGIGVGPNRVDFYWRRDLEVWHLTGHTDAFLAQGLVQSEWMPGFPGNNISSQIVILEKDGPRIIRGNLRGARKGNAWLGIVRRGRSGLFVRYAPPTEQRQQLNKRVDEIRARQQGEKKSTPVDLSYKPKSPGAFRHDWLNMVEMAMSLNHGRAEGCGFKFNKESADRINQAFSELRSAIAEGGVVQSKDSLHRDGNVIYLGAQPAAEVSP